MDKHDLDIAIGELESALTREGFSTKAYRRDTEADREMDRMRKALAAVLKALKAIRED